MRYFIHKYKYLISVFSVQLSLIEPADWWYTALPWLACLERVGRLQRLINIKYL